MDLDLAKKSVKHLDWNKEGCMCLTEKNSKEFIPVYRKIKKKHSSTVYTIYIPTKLHS